MEMWFSEFHTPDVKHSIRVTRHLYAKKSSYQQIDIFETPEYGRVLTLDGNVQLTERDEFIYDEMITHAHRRIVAFRRPSLSLLGVSPIRPRGIGVDDAVLLHAADLLSAHGKWILQGFRS